MRSKFFQKMFYNWQVKILCLLFAILVYFVLVFTIQAERKVTLPVSVNLPELYHAESNVPQTVNLVIQGTEDQIYMIDVSKISLSAEFSTVNREGVNYAVVQIDTNDLEDHVDMSSLHLYTIPSQLKVYFSLGGGEK